MIPIGGPTDPQLVAPAALRVESDPGMSAPDAPCRGLGQRIDEACVMTETE
jgi:hypothetical protein